MKKIYKQTLQSVSIAFLLFLAYTATSQTCNTCTYEPANGSTITSTQAGATYCIKAGRTVTLGQNLNDEAIFCIEDGAVLKSGNYNFGKDHTYNVYGTFDFPGSVSIQSGHINVYSSGTVSIAGAATVQNSTNVVNNGTFHVLGSLTIPSGSGEFFNDSEIIVEGDMEIQSFHFVGTPNSTIDVNGTTGLTLTNGNTDISGVTTASKLSFENTNATTVFNSQSITVIDGEIRVSGAFRLLGCMTTVNGPLTIVSSGRIRGDGGMLEVKSGTSSIQGGGFIRDDNGGNNIFFYDADTPTGYDSDRQPIRNGFDEFPTNANQIDNNNFTVAKNAPDCADLIVVLPVELTSFEAYKSGDDAILEWVTATETNNSHFEIERSVDGVHFNQIGREEGAGTTEQEQTYSYSDKQAAFVNNELFYRLKQVDFNGAVKYSSIRSVSFQNDKLETSAKLFPNPAKAGQQVVLQAKNIRTVELFTSNGQLVDRLEYNQQLSTTAISTDRLSPGFYVVIVNGTTHMKLVVQ